jgi:hypothetical protein
MLNNTLEFTSNNPIDKLLEENEDAIRVDYNEKNSKKLIAISDGAGGVGIYCKQWAEYIVENAPDNVPFEGLNQWFLGISKEFYLRYCGKDFSDIGTKEKFISAGSYATLLFLWIDYNKNLIHYVGIGDSSFFILRKDECENYIPIIIYPINNNEFIDQNPTLLNWKKSHQIDTIKSISIQKDDIILAATDSISRWILENLLIIEPKITRDLLNSNFKIENESLEKHKLSDYNFKNCEEIFKIIPKDKTTAIHFFENLIKNDFMEADDITLFTEKI